MKNEFMPPVRFELVLRHKKKEALKKVVKWLLQSDGDGSHPFQWEMIMLESTVEYQLSIQSSWAFTLYNIADILMEYKDNTV